MLGAAIISFLLSLPQIESESRALNVATQLIEFGFLNGLDSTEFSPDDSAYSVPKEWEKDFLTDYGSEPSHPPSPTQQEIAETPSSPPPGSDSITIGKESQSPSTDAQPSSRQEKSIPPIIGTSSTPTSSPRSTLTNLTPRTGTSCFRLTFT